MMNNDSANNGKKQSKKGFVKITRRLAINQKQRMVFAIAVSLSVFAIIGIIAYFQFAGMDNAHAAVSGDYRSKASGNWSDATKWEKFNGSSWAVASSAPTSTNGVIQILTGHTITVDNAFSVDQVVVDAGGTLAIAASKKLTVVNGSGTDITVNGSLSIAGEINLNASAMILAGTATMASGGKTTFTGAATLAMNNASVFTNNGGTIAPSAGVMTINSGANYVENYNNGTIPTASWNSGSTLSILGATANYPAGMGQTFGNVIFNSALTANVEMNSNLSCTGNLTISGTGLFTLFLTNSSTNRTISVGGNFNVSGGKFTEVGNSGTGAITVTGCYNLSAGTFTLKTGAGSSALTTTGDFNVTGGTFYARTVSTSSTATITVNGDFNQTAGTFDLSQIAATGTLNLLGDFSHTGGTLSTAVAGTGAIIFKYSGLQNYTSGGTVSGNVNYTVNSGATLVTGSNLVGNGSTGTFTLSSGGGLQIGDANGITSSGATGNIRVSGTRTFNASATYTYNGVAAQNTGNGLPATISNLVLNNVNGLTLTSTTSISNLLTLTTGKIITSTNELRITNSSTSAISGYSSSKYIIGNLRLTVSSSGTYTYPLGTATNYEVLQITLNSISGFSTLLGKFTAANPINISYPLTGVYISESPIDSMLDGGYWTLTPNSTMTSGTYDVKASESGYSNKISSIYYYPLLVRLNSTSSWQTNGNDRAFKYSANTMTANKTGMNIFGDLAIGFGVCPPIYGFDNHTLISGTDNQPGAVYLVSDIGMGLDAWVEITDFTGGATVSDFDNYTIGNGYDDAWQPFINATGNSTSSVGWKLTFKVGGTSTDTVIPNIVFAAIDVDGDGSSIKEFVTAYTPYSISYSSGSLLQIVDNAGNKTATAGTLSSFNNIDTINVQAMFKVNYRNVSSFRYRTGVINTGGALVRQASLYFKSFVTLPVTVLPIELMYFNAKINGETVDLLWGTASEVNNDYFTIERSTNGKDFQEILRKPGSGTSKSPHKYSAVDSHPMEGINYYRLKQTDYNGKYTYSSVKTIEFGSSKDKKNISIESIGPNPFTDHFKMEYRLTRKGIVTIQLGDISGHIIDTKNIEAEEGYNTFDYMDDKNLKPGVYIVMLTINDEVITRKLIKK